MTANPVFVNDMRRNYFRRRPVHAVAIMAGLILVLTLGLPILSGLVDIVMGSSMGLGKSIPLFRLPELALAIIVPAFTAGSFAREREQRTWFEVLLTPLRSEEILAGKFFAALIPTFASLIVLTPPLLMGFILSNVNWGMEPGPWIFVIGFKLLVNATFYVALVMLSSFFCSNARVSLVVAYVALGLYGALNLLIWNLFSPLFQSQILNFSPMTNQMQFDNGTGSSLTHFELTALDLMHLFQSIGFSALIFIFLYFQLQHRKDEKTP